MMGKVIFQHSNFQIIQLCPGVVEFAIPEENFRCRMWDYQLPQIEHFVVRGTGDLCFSEEVWDCTCHYNDICISQNEDAQYKIVCTDVENDRDDIVHQYTIHAVDFDLMMSAVIRALQENS
jgi:hypothetical protein